MVEQICDTMFPWQNLIGFTSYLIFSLVKTVWKFATCLVLQNVNFQQKNEKRKFVTLKIL